VKNDRYKTDAQIAQDVAYHLSLCPHLTMRKLVALVGSSSQRLRELHKAGVLPKIPRTLTPGQSATMAARATPWGNNFFLPNTPRGQKRIRKPHIAYITKE
jgi:hypothetical protein